MNFFDNMVLPQSAEHIQLINYLLVMIFFLFIPYIGILFVTSLLSLIYRLKGIKEGNPVYINFAATIIRMPTFNRSIGIILGIIPFLTITFMLSQILHKTDTYILQFLFTSFVLGTTGVILLYTYRYSQDFEDIYNRMKEKLNTDELKEEIERNSVRTNRLAGKSGLWGLLSLLAALWFFISAITMVLNPSLWTADSIYVLFSWEVMVYFLQFLAVSSALTGASLLFFFFYWEGGKPGINSQVDELLKKISTHLLFWSTLVIPILMLVILYSLNVEFLSKSVFISSTVALVLLFITLNLIYGMYKDSNIKLSGPIFFLVLFTALSLIIKDQTVMANATEQQAVILNAEFVQYVTELRGDRGVAEVNGKELFDVRCSSCHQFDQKLVGPPYNEVLLKYEGNIDQLVSYVLNPVKVDPAYPPMPNPGLKPNEARAVSEYILETYKK